MKQCVDELQNLGMSGNESKVYLALLRFNPVTGYQLGKQTGIRRSVIYDVLQRLIDRGAVYRIQKDPVKYVPVPYEKFLDALKNDFERSLNTVRSTLNAFSFEITREFVNYVKGAGNVHSEIRNLIESAESELLLEMWSPQEQDMRPPLERADRRGVKMFSMVFSESPVNLPGHIYYHDYLPLDVVQSRLKGRHTIVVRDNREVLIGKLLHEDSSWAVVTQDPALVMVAREFVIHDISMDLMIREFGREKLMQVLTKNPDMRGLIFNRIGSGPGPESDE